MENTIFVQIASYRDKQLLLTLRDCVSRATHPENLRFCIAWQRGSDESLEEFRGDQRFDIIDIPYQRSKGACWARNLIQQRYKGEKYTFQLDSHHRFVDGWDSKLISSIERLQAEGYKKPLLTSYIPSFNPENDPHERVNIPWKMNFDRFTPEGVVFFLPASIDDYRHLNNKPIKARFYSAHFCFTLGSFATEVQHDPNYYFHGEEISIAVRAYTHGYDLFHPTELIAWHEYTRNGRTKHWDDHPEWDQQNKECHLRNRKLLGIDNEINDIDFKKYGLGTVRSLEHYERYAGLCFRNRGVSTDTLQFKEPVINPDMSLKYKDWADSLNQIYKHCIDVATASIDQNEEYLFWLVAFYDKDGKEVYRQDANEEEVRSIMNSQKNQSHYNIWRTFTPAGLPKSWKVWPYSKTKQWLNQIDGSL
jgi:glycosyltransferase involved in cell wall biosynthesis